MTVVEEAIKAAAAESCWRHEWHFEWTGNPSGKEHLIQMTDNVVCQGMERL